MIKTEKLVKKYGKGELEITVLRDLDIFIEKGEFVAIIGPSGAGKSTLLYQMSLLDAPSSGEVYLQNKKTSILSEREKTALRLQNLGYVFQDYALLPELSALDNVMLPMFAAGLDKKTARIKAEAAMEKVRLSDKLLNRPSALSGGQQQRVSIARAIAHEPQILFADEPTANLDTASAEPVIEAFLELNRAGQTIIMVTHEEEYAAKAKRIIALKDGVVVSDKKQ